MAASLKCRVNSNVSHKTPEVEALEHPRKVLPPAAKPARRRGRGWVYFVLVVALAAGAYFWWSRAHSSSAGGGSASANNAKGFTLPPTPVVAARATSGNIGVYVTGLGAITPIYTDTIKSRVDGQLLNVHFKEGDLINQGDPLIDIDPKPYQAVVLQAEGALLRDQALLDNAHVDLARYQVLLSQNAIPEQQLATQRALVSQYEGTVKNDQGLLDAARVNLAYCHITAPITGVAGLRLVDPGNIVHATDTNGMVVITQIQPISVIFTISEDQMAPILQKYRAHQALPVEAWDRQLKTRLASGTLSTIDNQIDQTTGTLKLRATFANENRSLFPNQFVNARLLQQEKRGVTLLPSAAVQRNTNQTYVYLIKPDDTVTIRAIALGTTEGDQTEITSGLAPGDSVVMTGVEKLQEGSKVVVAGAANPGSSSPGSSNQ